MYKETGFRVSVISTIRETYNWVCCKLNEEGGGYVNNNMK